MDEKTQGLVIKLIDYKDADKLASIFTYDLGVITAKFRGVKKEKAKLKAIAQPFTFADFNIGKIANNKVVTSALLIDNFYNILNNYKISKHGVAYYVLKIAELEKLNVKPEQTKKYLSTFANVKEIGIWCSITEDPDTHEYWVSIRSKKVIISHSMKNIIY